MRILDIQAVWCAGLRHTRRTVAIEEELVGRDGIEPPTPGFSDLSLIFAHGAEVLVS